MVIDDKTSQSEGSGRAVWFQASCNSMVYIFTVYSNQDFANGVLLPDLPVENHVLHFELISYIEFLIRG